MDKKKTVLVIDDDFFVRSLLSYLLRESFDVKTVENGHKALLWLDQGNIPDLIITDIDMPELNGYEFIQHISKTGFYSDIPVIMLTGFVDETMIAKCAQAGAIGYLTKPFNPPSLLQIVNQALSNGIKTYA